MNLLLPAEENIRHRENEWKKISPEADGFGNHGTGTKIDGKDGILDGIQVTGGQETGIPDHLRRHTLGEEQQLMDQHGMAPKVTE